MRESTRDNATPSFFQWIVGRGVPVVWQSMTTVLSAEMVWLDGPCLITGGGWSNPAETKKVTLSCILIVESTNANCGEFIGNMFHTKRQIFFKSFAFAAARTCIPLSLSGLRTWVIMLIIIMPWIYEGFFKTPKALYIKAIIHPHQWCHSCPGETDSSVAANLKQKLLQPLVQHPLYTFIRCFLGGESCPPDSTKKFNSSEI